MQQHADEISSLPDTGVTEIISACLDCVCEETGDWPLDIDDLLRFSFQVAQGLDFLAAKNVSDFAIERI